MIKQKQYHGYDYMVYYHKVGGDREYPHTGMAHYNAYIRIPKNHPFYKFAKEADYDQIPLDVHGGLTFAKVITKDIAREEGFTPGFWVGWDYAHLGDEVYDLEVLKEASPELYRIHTSSPLIEHRWTEIEVELEVIEAIKQLEASEKSRI